MVNVEDFIKRLEKLLDYFGLTASSFADKIGVQRSSLSHLLSGRNKPSLDFILKITEIFPEVDLYWILNGKGNFPKNDETEKPNEPVLRTENIPNDLFRISSAEGSNFKAESPKIAQKNSYEGNIEKIVVFYSNGTFKEYKPE